MKKGLYLATEPSNNLQSIKLFLRQMSVPRVKNHSHCKGKPKIQDFQINPKKSLNPDRLSENGRHAANICKPFHKRRVSLDLALVVCGLQIHPKICIDA